VKGPDGSANASTIEMDAGRDIVIASDIHHIGGDPVGQWDEVVVNWEAKAKQDVDNGNADIPANQSGTNSGTNPDGSAVITSDGATIAGNNVFITARLLNLNGKVQSGKPDRDLFLDDGLNDDMDNHRNAYLISGNTDTLLLNTSNSNIEAEYNPVTDRIEMDTVSVEGGYMQLTGNIISTATGTLNVMDGFGDIDITNETDRAIDLRTIDTGKDRLSKVDGSDTLVFDHDDALADTVTRTNGSWITDNFENGQRISVVGSLLNDGEYRVSDVSDKVLTLVSTEVLTDESAGVASVEVRGHGNGIEGTLVITDTAKLVGGSTPLTTTWTHVGNDIQISDNNGRSDVIANARGAVYEPLDDQRYGWSTGNTSSTTIIEKWVSRSVWGFNWLIADPPDPPLETEVIPGLPTKPLIPEGFTSNTYVAVVDPTANIDGYSYQWDSNFSTTVTKVNKTTSHGWWIFSYQEHTLTKTTKSGGNEFHDHTVKADYDVNINFIGNKTGTVDVTSLNDINIDGPIRNLSGTTTLTSTQGSINQLSNTAALQSENIVLDSLQADLGSGFDPIRTDLQGGAISADAAGDIHIVEVNGDLAVDQISSGGDVSLEADSISSWDAGASIEANSITLTAHAGSIGSATQALQVDMGSAGGDTFGDAGDTFNASAMHDIHLREIDGDLRLEKVTSTLGDVDISVSSGNLLDVNEAGTADLRAIEQLRSLWIDMNLTGAGASAAAAQNVDAFESMKTRDYHIYWSYRNQQADPSRFDPDFQVQLSDAERDYYLNEKGWSVDAVNALQDKRTDEYHALHDDYGSLGDTYNETYAYTVTAEEYAGLTAGFAWTESQLANSISAGVFREKTDTELQIEDPNIVANNVTLNVSGGVGIISGQFTIDLSKGISDLSGEEKLMLAAAETDDMVFRNAALEVIDPRDPDAVADTLTITLHDDLDVEADEAITIDAGSHVYLGAEQDINVNTIDAGTDIRIKGGSGIYTIVADGHINVTGDNVVLEAAGADIGRSGEALELDLRAAGKLTARAADGVYLSQQNGVLGIDTIYSRLGIVELSGNSLVDANDDELWNIKTDLLTVTDTGSVGEPGDALDIDLPNDTGLLNVAASGDIYINEVAGNMNVERVLSTGGNVTLRAASSILDADFDASGLPS